jgi:hypothetical protein
MNLTPLALAAAYAYLNRSDKEKGDKEAPAATPTIAPAAAPAAQTTNAANMLSANDALNAGMGDYDTTGNIGKPMPMAKPPRKKPVTSSSSDKPTTTSTRYPKISIAQATEDMEAGKKLAPPRKTNALGMELNEGTEEGLARMRERDRTVRGMPNIGDNISQSLENIRNRVKQNIGMKKGGDVKAYAKGGTVSASKRGDGIAQRGYTKGKIV